MELVKSQQIIIRAQNEPHATERQQMAEERQQMEARFNSQTDRLREIQRALVAANERELRLTRIIAAKDRFIEWLKYWHCKRDYTDCGRREPKQEVQTIYIEMKEDDNIEIG